MLVINRSKQAPIISCVTALALTFVFGFVMPAIADNKGDLSDSVYDYSGCYWKQFMVQKLMNFQLSPAIWTKMLEKDGWGIKTASNYAAGIGEYAKKNGWGDFEEAESANNNDRKNNSPKVEQMVDSIKDKIGFTLVADGIKGTDAEWDLVHRYMGTLGEFVESASWKPKSGAAFITLTVQPAKDVSVSVGPDGKHFAVIAPSDHEVEDWDGKMTKGLQKAGR